MTREGIKLLLISALLDEMTPDRKLFIDSLHIMIPTTQGLYQVRRGSRKAIRRSGKSDIYTLLRTQQGLLAFASDGIYKIGKGGMSG